MPFVGTGLSMLTASVDLYAFSHHLYRNTSDMLSMRSVGTSLWRHHHL